MPRYYEDLEIGEVHQAGGRTLTEADIVAFATDYDPLPMHRDPAAAEATVHDGLIASGWQTAAVTWRLAVDAHFGQVALIGGWGVDDFRWPNPVRPGDTLSVEVELVDRSLVSKPDRGAVDYRVVTTNDRDDEVLRYIDHALVERRNATTESVR